MLKTETEFDIKFGRICNGFLMDFWIDFGAILDVFWNEKSMHFSDRFLDVLFLRLGSVAPLQRDFGRGVYGPDAPQAAPLSRE